MYVHFNVRTYQDAVISLRDQQGNTIESNDFNHARALVIQNDGIYSLELPEVFVKHKDLISKFDKVMWFSPSEAHPKIIDRRLFREASTLNVFETVYAFKKQFLNADIKYFDNDMDTGNDFRKWLRFNKLYPAPFSADYWYGNKWGLTLVDPLAKYFNTDVETLLFKVLPSIIDNRKCSKLYWSFNFKKRWGKVLAVYLLHKHNLIDIGDVTMHSDFVNYRFVKILRSYGFEINDLDGFNDILPMRPYKLVDDSFIPTEYFKSPFENLLDYPINLATETHFFETNRTFTEKTIKPLVFGQIILPMASYNVYHSMSELFGFKFTPTTYEIDKISDPIRRAEKVIECLKLFKNSPMYLKQEIKILKDNYQSNMEIMLDHNKNNEWKFIKEQIESWK